MLAKTLAGLTHQTYPKALFEVIIADDGSSDHPESLIEVFKSCLSIKIVKQQDQGYRLSAVRNLAMKAATSQYIIMLDCDVVPAREYIESFMMYFHISEKTVLFGLRRFVNIENYSYQDILDNADYVKDFQPCPSGSAELPIQNEAGEYLDWRDPLLIRTNNLKEAVFPFSVFSGCCQAFPLSVIEEVGGYDEEFNAWGGEDIEFGYRLYNAGYYFIPVEAARGYHQETNSDTENFQADREQGKEMTTPLFIDKCPHPHYRKQDHRNQQGQRSPKPYTLFDSPGIHLYSCL